MEDKSYKQLSAENYHMVMHMAFKKQHILEYAGVFKCEGHPLHGKKFRHITTTPKKNGFTFGKPIVDIFLEEDSKHRFSSFKDIYNHYKQQP